MAERPMFDGQMPERAEWRRLIEQRRSRQHRDLLQFTRRLAILMSALLALGIAGTVGYAAIEGTSIGYAASWTLDTITTLGAIPAPTDTAGRVLQSLLELFGIGTLFYGLATVAEFFVSGQLSGLLSARRMQRMIDAYKDHYIVCGYGRVGRQVVRDLRAAGVDFVVVDPNPARRDPAAEDGVTLIEHSAAEDDVLLSAGVERAAGVIACVDSDAENIFIALSARGLRADVLIVARASREDAEQKLLRAGADRVISPYKTSGTEMARIALHPQVGGVVDVADFRIEEIEVPADCRGAGRTINEVRGQSVIVALRRVDGGLEPQPSPQAVINAGDKVIAIGAPAAIEQLEAAFQPAGAVAT
ncbi:MAG TPA: potassium channel protein [Solirubrobacteraceae bacterium]|jgi:voltage-gated potassium channel|nr:potassium channel protein [Solirubrobacteraceae bacterium]